MMKNILLIEDEQSVASFIRKGLKEEGYHVFVTYDAETGLVVLQQNDIHLILLDIILPGMNGYEICKKVRDLEFRDIPILMLSALGTTDNVVKGLDIGADDYLAKPFKFKELLARIRTLLRRSTVSGKLIIPLSIADLRLDQNLKIAIRANKEIKLTSTEYRLLEHFIKNQNKVLSRTELLESVWDVNFDMGTNVVDVYVNYLRNKIDKGFEPKLIHTVIGMGYIMKPD